METYQLKIMYSIIYHKKIDTEKYVYCNRLYQLKISSRTFRFTTRILNCINNFDYGFK